MYSRLRCSARRSRRARDAGGVLPLVLVMLSLAALLANAGLERVTDRSLLARAATERNRLHEITAKALAAGIRDAENRGCPDDKNYPWSQDMDVDAGEDGYDADYTIEQLAHRAGGACRLLVTATARAAGGDKMFGQALLSLPQATRDAVRIYMPSP